MTALCASQALQAQLCAEQEAGAAKEAALEAAQRQREALEAQLQDAQNSGPDMQHRNSGSSEPPLLLPATSDSQVCPVQARFACARYHASTLGHQRLPVMHCLEQATSLHLLP